MKFSYSKLTLGRLQPIIVIKVRHPKTGKEVSVSVLVDSGADGNYFHAIVAKLIGLDLTHGEKSMVQGIGNAAESVQADVDLVVGGWVIPTRVGFLKNFAGYAQGVVGQRGFFDQFKFVKFEHAKGTIELGEPTIFERD